MKEPSTQNVLKENAAQIFDFCFLCVDVLLERYLFVYNVHTNLFIASIAAVHMTVEWVFNKKKKERTSQKDQANEWRSLYRNGKRKMPNAYTQLWVYYKNVLNFNSIRKRAFAKFMAGKISARLQKNSNTIGDRVCVWVVTARKMEILRNKFIVKRKKKHASPLKIADETIQHPLAAAY